MSDVVLNLYKIFQAFANRLYLVPKDYKVLKFFYIFCFYSRYTTIHKIIILLDISDHFFYIYLSSRSKRIVWPSCNSSLSSPVLVQNLRIWIDISFGTSCVFCVYYWDQFFFPAKSVGTLFLSLHRSVNNPIRTLSFTNRCIASVFRLNFTSSNILDCLRGI